MNLQALQPQKQDPPSTSLFSEHHQAIYPVEASPRFFAVCTGHRGQAALPRGLKAPVCHPAAHQPLGQDGTGIGASLTSCSGTPMLSEQERRPPIALDSCCWSRGSELQSCLLLSPVLVQPLPLPLPGGSEEQAHFAGTETAARSHRAPSSSSRCPRPLLCRASCAGRSPAGGTAGTHRDSRASSCPLKRGVSRRPRAQHGAPSRARKRSPPARHRAPGHGTGHRRCAYLHAVILLVATTFASWREEEGD